ICKRASAGITVDVSLYEPHITGSTLAHVIGHTLGMVHDDGNCRCYDWHGCIMAPSILGKEDVQPYRFSECSLEEYTTKLRRGHANFGGTCGNGIVDEKEDCDCGLQANCADVDKCCDSMTCLLKADAECAAGPCCDDNCRLKSKGEVCRPLANECDIPEVCDGVLGACPVDIYMKNGNECDNKQSYCFNGVCASRRKQCEQIWGSGSRPADPACYIHFNNDQGKAGNCGRDNMGREKTCAPENVSCGSLICQGGGRTAIPSVSNLQSATTITDINVNGTKYECKIFSTQTDNDFGLVQDGTACHQNMICINQTCASIFPYVSRRSCPSNNREIECSGH
ncbi:unnamed protein product, partial [Cyprideis torosa]